MATPPPLGSAPPSLLRVSDSPLQTPPPPLPDPPPPFQTPVFSPNPAPSSPEPAPSSPEPAPSSPDPAPLPWPAPMPCSLRQSLLACLCCHTKLLALPPSPPLNMVRHIGNLDEFKQSLADAGSKLVVVDFTATWCGPCKMIAPFFEGLSEKYQEVVFLKVDVDDAQDVATHCDIKCMPTFHFYKNCEKIHEFSGANQSSLEQKVKELS